MEFPKEYFLKISNDSHREGRITINLIPEDSGTKFSAEIDIVQKESRKIWSHVDILYNISEEKEALDLAVQKLTQFLQQN